MLGGFPTGKAIWLLSSHSPSSARRARLDLHYRESVAFVRLFPAAERQRRSSSSKRASFHLCRRVHSTFANGAPNRSPIRRRSILFPPFGTRTDGETGRKGSVQQMSLIRSKRWLASFSLLDLDLTCATFPLSFSLWQRPNAFSIGFDCIRIFGVLLRCGCLGERGGTGRPLEEEEMLWARRRFWCP